MIKTDAQLERTRSAIVDFEQQCASAETLDDLVLRELSVSSLRGMIKSLSLEIDRYLDAKAGSIKVPAHFESITDLCPFITDLRIALGWTQENLADRLGMTRQAVNKMEEHEYQEIGVDRLRDILEAMNVRVQIAVKHEVVELVRPRTAARERYRTARSTARPALAV